MSVAPEPLDGSEDQPTAPLVSAGASDRCPVCGAQLAVDQRYCVECGTRRGAPRFTLSAPPAPPSAPAARPMARGPLRRVAPPAFMEPLSGSVLLVGIVVILLALGVGVLIGHNNSPQNSSKPYVVNVGGGSAAAPAAAAPTSAGTAAGSSSAPASSSTKKTASAKKTAKKTVAAAVPSKSNTAPVAKGKAAVAAAAKSFSPTATKKSTLGGSCTPGTPGCQGGKQTGNLF